MLTLLLCMVNPLFWVLRSYTQVTTLDQDAFPVPRASRAHKFLTHIHHCMTLQKPIQLLFESLVPIGRYLKKTVVKRNFGHR